MIDICCSFLLPRLSIRIMGTCEVVTLGGIMVPYSVQYESSRQYQHADHKILYLFLRMSTFIQIFYKSVCTIVTTSEDFRIY